MIARWELLYSRKWIFSTNVYDFSVVSENSGIFSKELKLLKEYSSKSYFVENDIDILIVFL